jgi:hypothetical protein
VIYWQRQLDSAEGLLSRVLGLILKASDANFAIIGSRPGNKLKECRNANKPCLKDTFLFRSIEEGRLLDPSDFHVPEEQKEEQMNQPIAVEDEVAAVHEPMPRFNPPMFHPANTVFHERPLPRLRPAEHAPRDLETDLSGIVKVVKNPPFSLKGNRVRKLGRGGFGQVYRVYLSDEKKAQLINDFTPSCNYVVVKVLSIPIPKRGREYIRVTTFHIYVKLSERLR